MCRPLFCRGCGPPVQLFLQENIAPRLPFPARGASEISNDFDRKNIENCILLLQSKRRLFPARNETKVSSQWGQCLWKLFCRKPGCAVFHHSFCGRNKSQFCRSLSYTCADTRNSVHGHYSFFRKEAPLSFTWPQDYRQACEQGRRKIHLT